MWMKTGGRCGYCVNDTNYCQGGGYRPIMARFGFYATFLFGLFRDEETVAKHLFWSLVLAGKLQALKR
jgi:hypothetical protein